MPHQESELIALSLAGNTEAFAKLYETYLTPIYRYHYYRTFHRETAEDLTSQTFMRALEHLKTYDEAKGAFSAWLYRIARNLLIDHVRAHRPTVDTEEVLDTTWDGKNLARSVEQNETLERVKAHISHLPLEQREIILLRLWDERSYQEIAEITQKSEAACKMTVSRALQTIRKQVPLAIFLSLVYTSLLSHYVSPSLLTSIDS